MNKERKFKYYPKDFPELNVKNIHYNLEFDMFDEHTNVNSKISFVMLKSANKISLDARKMEIKNVKANRKIEWTFDEKKSKLNLIFDKTLKIGEKIIIETEHKIKPTWNDLEGLYYDKSPKGAPPQQITQCQQWGFQKLTPCFDYMNAKATYKTKIIADKRYTHLISNGNVLEKGKKSENRKYIIYVNEKVPMAPYMFFLGAGTWKETNRELEYANGKKFQLQMLTLENATLEAIKQSLEILAFGVQWVNIFTGGERNKNIEKRKKIFDLCFERDKAKQNGDKNKIKKLKGEINKLSKGIKFGYEYSGEAYREIAMQNSNFGGMENVGNTTISANRMLPYKEMSDGLFTYLLNVKTHEFYHNLNGSEVTSHSPFDLWLNEAITEYTTGDEFISFATSKEFARLENVSRIIMKGGTFDEDTGALGHPMKPEGFNMPDDLITGITYSKGPEFIRMIKITIGEDKFYQAMQKYHEKYAHSNAKTEDWINTMEKFSGKKISRMTKTWLTQIGYPIVNVKTNFDKEKKKVKIELKQTGFKKGLHWEFPFSYAIFNNDGKKIHEETIMTKKEKQNIEIEGIESIGFFSFNRDFSFYGKVIHPISKEELLLQVEKDDDIISKYVAFYNLVEKERMNALKNNKIELDKTLIDIYFNLLSNKELTEKLGSTLLAIPSGVEDKYLRHEYVKLYEIEKKIKTDIAKKYENELLSIYQTTAKKNFEGDYVKKSLAEIKNRSIKNSCLGVLSRLDSEKIHSLILKQFREANNQTDKLVAFSLYLDSSAKDRLKIMEEFEKESIGNPVQWEQFLSIVARGDSEDTLEQVKRIKKSEHFNITQSNDQRALLVSFIMNKRKSLLKKDGLKFVKETIIELAKLNEYTANHALSVFEELNYMKENELAEYVKLLTNVMKELSFEKQPSVFNNIKKILNSAPRAVKLYEKEYGKLNVQ